jgi:hypothetical protein
VVKFSSAATTSNWASKGDDIVGSFSVADLQTIPLGEEKHET